MNDKAQDIKDFHNSVNKLPSWLVNDVLYIVGDKILITEGRYKGREAIILKYVGIDCFEALTFDYERDSFYLKIALHNTEFEKVE